LSVAAFQVRDTEVAVGVVAASPDGVLGGVVSTVQVEVAGVGSLPALVVAYTEKVWLPWVRPGYVFGLVHVEAAAASSRQVKVAEPPPEALKANVALVLAVTSGGAVLIVVSGGLGAAVAGEATAIISGTTITAAPSVNTRLNRPATLPMRTALAAQLAKLRSA
jgi:hypothetical protein